MIDPKDSRCPCGGIILADTEDWKTPVCYNCWEEIGSPATEPQVIQSLGNEARTKSEKVKVLIDALESIAAFHLTEKQISACGGDTVLTDSQISRYALRQWKGEE